MKKLIISVPARTSDNFGDPISVFFNVISQVNSSNTNEIEFDFDNCKFASPFLIGGLTAIANSNQENGGKNTWVYNKGNEYLSGYLNTISFPNGFDYSNVNIQTFDTIFEPYHEKNYIPIVCFPSGKMTQENKVREKILSAINTIFKKQLKLEGDILKGIFYLIDELTQNIVDHSDVGKGIVFAQFYPSKNYMDVCIVDYGKGLYKSYIDSKKHNPKTTKEAMNFAVYGKSTKDIPESRGFGLSTSRKMLVEGLKGKFFLLSDDVFFVQTIEREEVIQVPNINRYKGCYIALRIPLLQSEQFSFYKYVE
jgi:hypothetical protein